VPFDVTAPIDDPATTFRAADHHLRELLFGDGIDHVGLVKGSERRDEVTRALRRMREAFEVALTSAEEGKAAATLVSDIEQELLRRASKRATRTRRPRKSAT
jgi:hypothetical protein